jgi:aryl-alcohol dehydrogenase-like predicted oxidoreductase
VQYLRAVERLDRFAQENYGKRVIQLALRWVLDRQDSTIALWGARRPDQLAPVAGLSGWHIDASAMVEIDRILSETIVDAVGPEFMAPPNRHAA